MKIETITTAKTIIEEKTIYTAEDGAVFENRGACEQYEKILEMHNKGIKFFSDDVGIEEIQPLTFMRYGGNIGVENKEQFAFIGKLLEDYEENSCLLEDGDCFFIKGVSFSLIEILDYFALKNCVNEIFRK